MRNTLYIINPAGHGGTGIEIWERFKSAFPETIRPENVAVTTRPGHAREIAASADGYETLAAAGGDGTVGEVMTAIMSRGAADIDGDLYGVTPVVFTVCPGAITILTPNASNQGSDHE
jgi:diacylglycerol kinase family enzyme